ncbi:MAG: aminopeptidase P family protein [Puniceicoccales bacterium]|jgi:Xaa-Pro aminopeptidase|nr:aminopeptidase P family protein [Puniceicoccales bacterium]
MEPEELLVNLRTFLSKNSLDYLLINGTDQFLVELNELSHNSRYHLTGFSGSCGEALLSKDRLWLFVDGRYHEQAAAEMHSYVSLCKLQMGAVFLEKLLEKVREESSFAVISKKISLQFYDDLRNALERKHVNMIALSNDPVDIFYPITAETEILSAEKIDESIAPATADVMWERFSQMLDGDHAFLETNLENIAYFTNLRHYGSLYASTVRAKLLITKTVALLFTDVPVKFVGQHFQIHPLDDFEKFLGRWKICYTPMTINYADFSAIGDGAIPWKEDIIGQWKSVKSDHEIAHYREIFSHADRVMERLEEHIHSSIGLSEKELSLAVEKEFLLQGAKCLSFPTILAIGKNSAVIHHCSPREDIFLKSGDIVLLDCGAYFSGGYATDMTRTFIVGEPDHLQKLVYSTVFKMFINSYHHAMDEHTTGNALDQIARNIAEHSRLLTNGFHFNHALGHGLGIGVHESPPAISSRGNDPLLPSMIFTLEPGLYRKGFGGVRLENAVLLVRDEDGHHRLESLSRMKFQENAIDTRLLTQREIHWLHQWQESAGQTP